MEKFLNVRELAELIPFSAWSINQLCRDEAIPHYRMNGRCYFKLSKIKPWIESKEQKMRRGACTVS